MSTIAVTIKSDLVGLGEITLDSSADAEGVRALANYLEACAGGCSSGLWLLVAAAREEKHPGDAVPIYQEMLAPILKQANNAAYEEAVKLLQKIRELMGRLDRVTEFEDYLGALRVDYKRKRNFIKLLDAIERS